MNKTKINGPDANPLFKFLKQNVQDKTDLVDGKVPWNFSKFLVDGNGKVIKFYKQFVEPYDILPDIVKLLHPVRSNIKWDKAKERNYEILDKAFWYQTNYKLFTPSK